MHRHQGGGGETWCRFSCEKYKKRLAFGEGFVYYFVAPTKGAKQESEVSSVVEHILHTDGVISSNLILRISIKSLQIVDLQGFLFCLSLKCTRICPSHPRLAGVSEVSALGNQASMGLHAIFGHTCPRNFIHQKLNIQNPTLHGLQHVEGLAEFIGGFDFLEAGEALVVEDVVVVAGEHEFLPADFDVGDVAPGGEDADFVDGEQVAHFAGQGTEAVAPLAVEVVHIIGGAGAGELCVRLHAGFGGFHVGGGEVGAEEFVGIGSGGHAGLAEADEVGLEGGLGPDGGHLTLHALNGLAEELTVQLEPDGGDVAALLGA